MKHCQDNNTNSFGRKRESPPPKTINDCSSDNIESSKVMNNQKKNIIPSRTGCDQLNPQNGSWRSSVDANRTTMRAAAQTMDTYYSTKPRHGTNGQYNRPQYNCVQSNRAQSSGNTEIPKSHTYSPVIKTIVKNINLEYVRPQRAGIIIYTVTNGSIFFGLGLDSRTHDLTDFGGGVYYKLDINVLRGATREFEEETLEIFEPFTIEDIKQCPVIYDDNNLIVFVHLDIDPDATCSAFNEKYKQIVDKQHFYSDKMRYIREPEVCGITWLTWEEFRYVIETKGIMFSRVQKFLARAGDFSYLL